MYQVENGTPQGSVCSPTFNTMINDIVQQIEPNVGKSLFADDGVLWVRGIKLDTYRKNFRVQLRR